MVNLSQHNATYTRLVDEYSRYITSPVHRLKFLNSALSVNQRPGSLSSRLIGRLPLVGSISERALIAVEVSKYLPPGRPTPAGIRLASVLYKLRLLVYAASLLFVLGAGGGLVYVVGKVIGSLPVSTEAKDVNIKSSAGEPPAPGSTSPGLTMVGAAALPPERVWLAEGGDGYEFYSNGARILTEFETEGQPRRFYRFDFDGNEMSLEGEKNSASPIGIVYHLSEGDLFPFANTYNSSLQTASRSLLEYSKEHGLYNYVIDRFGRVYRVVRDEMTASHAGNSLWSDGSAAYINLSSSFIGVCLEGKSSGPVIGPDGINEAQIYGARVLTAVLRSKYNIQDQNCVTHGLVSINPSNRLMGYHTDWVSGFPFEALGLTDKNESEMAAIARFGFNYDNKYLLSAGGHKWRGIERADESVKRLALLKGIPAEEERKGAWKAFKQAYEKQRRLDAPRDGQQ